MNKKYNMEYLAPYGLGSPWKTLRYIKIKTLIP